MFDFFRRHTRALQFLLVLLIFPSFVFFGIQGYSRFAGGVRVYDAQARTVGFVCLGGGRVDTRVECAGVGSHARVFLDLAGVDAQHGQYLDERSDERLRA